MALPPSITSPAPVNMLDDEAVDADADAGDLPMTMAASVVLTTLPKDAHAALEKAGDLDVEKVTVRFKALPSAPVLRQNAFKVKSSHRFDFVVRSLRKKLGVKDSESVFCYVKQVFAPGLDEGVGNLWRCFRTDGELIVWYSVTPAFG
ncbi:APG12-domain-containing protein [Pseudovirgaria hyperparasitica]|uniref:Ubiquitin-like protein ATG12 n=1 Tax=Pseudovirgaria hyperparasitica TaxID=470096 RepID=A0A6A6WEK7_9PEZI|nr:APG12-domain-containing protein [Pseudovirgaria hyperparasitica]KAF2760316.1 APG12-domain-containing protein [Pseudovirgaria hyperparasitica]